VVVVVVTLVPFCTVAKQLAIDGGTLSSSGMVQDINSYTQVHRPMTARARTISDTHHELAVIVV
jgi:phage baseplate assembly protein gpV